MVTPVRCPVCEETAAAQKCGRCGSDLSPLLEARHGAYRLAMKAKELASGRQLSRAADRAEDAMQLFLDDELRRFLGWLLFLDGRLTEAGHCWREVPEHARSIVDMYNEALRSARRSSCPKALQTLEAIDLPFRPAVVLRLVCAERVGDFTKRREARELIAASFPEVALPDRSHLPGTDPSRTGSERTLRRSRSVMLTTASALALLLVGLGAGYLLRPPGANETAPPDEGAPRPDDAPGPVATDPVDGPSPHSGAPDSLRLGWAYLLREAQVVYDAVEDTVGPDPIDEVRDVPTPVRYIAGRDWYLAGLELYQADSLQEATVPLTAAVASVGASSDRYWVDDAIYLLTRSLERTDRRAASTWARILVAHHDTSMYANSVTQSLAADSREANQ